MFYYLILFLFLISGCSEIDPGSGVNHIHMGKFVLDLTLGPFATLVAIPLIIWGVKVVLVRLFNRWDEATKTALHAKEELDKERHGHIVTKLDSMCSRFDKVDQRFHEHEHLVEIDGKIYKSDGKVTGKHIGGP